MPNDKLPERDFLSTLAKGLSVIELFGEPSRYLTQSEVADRLGITKAAARRILLTLAELGYAQADGRRFSLKPRVLRLGYAYLCTQGWLEIAQPELDRLMTDLDECCSIAMIDFPDIVLLARAVVRRIMSISLNTGVRLPSVHTSQGRVLLAFMGEIQRDAVLEASRYDALTVNTLTDRARIREIIETVRAQRYSIVEGEVDLNMHAISVPIFAPDKSVPYALSVSTQASRHDRASLEAMVPRMSETAQALGDILKAFHRQS
ncbi:IclR family transcriptional regulator C-terminal domain-containing protein [Mesorhizobium sp. B4-1-4]|uniref:IclR family transcriptional regulator domain-containing protein n=1 Tax=Mesorhizobium sp. B4-1-4 TaxID=2589888 RepID=UPI001129AF17|nr:IclR family transcriptional regulator C-terminal domain-containing protein [Mesorhizobium sp. B4-1-4]UCI31920.1 helix-turn-helix domain-containing protein [Mesorhizobium sp. B4-1-4]